MITFELVTDTDEWANEVVAMFEDALDLRPIAESMGEIAVEDNATARLSGLDRFGAEVLEILPSTEKWRRKHGKGDGPALDPDGPASSVVTGMTTEVTRDDAFTWSLWGVWPDWVRHHRDGIPSNVGLRVRDVMGLTPDGDARIHEKFSEGLDQIMSEIK